MNDIIDSLDENTCKLLIDRLVKKAFGKDAIAEIKGENAVKNFIIKLSSKSSSYFYMFGFSREGYCEGMNFSDVLESLDKPTWKNILKKCLNVVAHGGYVSYLDHVKRMLDNGMTLEQLLVENDLASIVA